MMIGICGVMIDMEEFSYDSLRRTLEQNGVASPHNEAAAQHRYVAHPPHGRPAG